MSSADWELLCGHGETQFVLWNSTVNDFGVCFEKLAFSCIPHCCVAITSAYHFSRHQSRRVRGHISYSPTLHVRLVAALSTVLCCIAVLVTAFLASEFRVGLIDVMDYGFRFVAWAVHCGFIWRLHRYHHIHLRGTKSTSISTLLTVVLSLILVQSAVRQQIRESRSLPTLSEWFLYGFVVLYLFYCLTLIPHRRPQLSPLFLNVQDELGDQYSFISSSSTSARHQIRLGNAVDKAGFFSKLSFSWVGQLMSTGAKGCISSVNDVFDLPQVLCTDSVDNRFHQYLQSPVVNAVHPENNTVSTSVKKQQSMLMLALRKMLGFEYFMAGIMKLLADAMSFGGPVLLNFLLVFMTEPSEPMWHGYLYSGGLFVTTLLGAFLSTHFNYHVGVVGFKVRAAVISAVYRKTLVISLASVTGSKVGTVKNKDEKQFGGTGEVVNLMSTDVDRIVNFCPSFHQLWSLPLQVGAALYLLYQQVNLSFLAGLGFAILLIPINRWIAVKIGSLSQTLMSQKDARVKVVNEAMYGMRAIKLNAWESIFSKRVSSLRKAEVKSLSARKYLDALCVFFWATSTIIISILTFLTYVMLGNQLTAAKVFTSIALFGILIVPLNAFPWVINGMMEAWVSLRRVQNFLEVSEIDWNQYYATASDLDHDVVIEDGSFTWQFTVGTGDKGRNSSNACNGQASDNDRQRSNGAMNDSWSDRNLLVSSGSSHDDANDNIFNDILTLRSVNLSVSKGALIGVIGRVGAGKSALLSAIAAEMNRAGGQVILGSGVLQRGFGFVTQDAWIQHATLRDNILFGTAYNKRKYDSVISSCALLEDLRILPAGDETEIGENGVTLSGGQKARVSLARVVYQEKPVYLLDDPLAAVDVHVAKHLYDKCINGILVGTTRILVTHHVNFLRDADFIIVMENGRIVQTGPPSVVLSNIDFPLPSNNSANVDSSKESETRTETRSKSQSGQDCNDMECNDSSLVQAESSETGVVKAHVYRSYWVAVGRFLAGMVLLSIFLMQASRNVTDWWLSHWISETSRNVSAFHDSNTTHTLARKTLLLASLQDSTYKVAELHTNHWQQLIGASSIGTNSSVTPDTSLHYYLMVYGILAGVNSFCTLIRAFLFAYGGIEAAIILHKQLLDAILKAPVSFFDATPIGRILNRFSSDIYCIDDTLPFVLNIFLAQAFGVVGVIVICCYGLPYFTILIVPLGLVYYFIQQYYRHTSRELKRISSVTLSPIYAHFAETVTGLTTVRALREMERFKRENRDRLELNQRAQFAGMAASQWLSLRLQLIGVAMVTGVATIAILEHRFHTVDPSLIGLAISYVLSVTGLLNGVVTFFTETEKQMVSVERVEQYISNIPQEPDTSLLCVPPRWPINGCIRFNRVCLRYRAGLPLALSEVTFETKPGEKIGIVGRTGAGKSSLFMVLFRLVDIESGAVTIDDLDIRHLPLLDLRSRMAIIPQDPFLFSGTVRDNIDPTGTLYDEPIEDAIERCHLQATVERLGGLDGLITERGRDLSSGERQLVCLARALLSKTQILCIDEATASVDHATDAAIQTTIREQFVGRTVMTVAHRLSTVINTSDRVLVMDVGGRLVEFASPDALLSNASSMFYSLVHGSTT